MRRWITTLLVLASLTPAAHAADEGGKRQITALTMTAERLYEESAQELAQMRKILAAHQGVLDDAKQSDLVVAVDAVRKDLSASRELYSFATGRLKSLKTDLALDKAGSDPNRIVDDALSYPQVREIQILRDQMERLYHAGRRFLASLKKPTETVVTRMEASETDDVDDAERDDDEAGEADEAIDAGAEAESEAAE